MFDKLVKENAMLCILASISWAADSVLNIVAAILLGISGHWIIGGLMFIVGVIGVTIYGMSLYLGYKLEEKEEL